MKNNEEKSISDERKEKNFRALKTFLKLDMSVKEDLLRTAPAAEDNFNVDSRIEYTDKLDSLLKDFYVELNLISEGFEFSDIVSNAISEFIKKARQNLAVGKYESGIINDLYKKNFSNMDPKFVEEVKDKCVGYINHSPEMLAGLIGKATTVNEMLHVMHSFIMNNEKIMGMMPMINSKKNSSNYSINLYGDSSEIATRIFEQFPHELDVGFTDIISMQNRIFMMIRDRGHALTIDMDTSKEDDVDVKYFIPKLCNEEMIRALKGIDPSSITPNGARGHFTASQGEITNELFGFIEKVPTDLDIPGLFDHTEYFNYAEPFEVPIQPEELNVAPPAPTQPEFKPFSVEQAKELAMQPERKFGKIKEIATRVANLFNPLISKLKGDKSQDSKEDNEK